MRSGTWMLPRSIFTYTESRRENNDEVKCMKMFCMEYISIGTQSCACVHAWWWWLSSCTKMINSWKPGWNIRLGCLSKIKAVTRGYFLYIMIKAN